MKKKKKVKGGLIVENKGFLGHHPNGIRGRRSLEVIDDLFIPPFYNDYMPSDDTMRTIYFCLHYIKYRPRKFTQWLVPDTFVLSSFCDA